MSLLNQLRERSSAKKFDSRAIPEETLDQILEATSYSPRAGNLQQFSIRMVTSREDMTRLSQIYFNCEITLKASALLIFFADLHTTRSYFEAEGAEYPFSNLVGYHYAAADAIVAMQTAALTAESLGLSTRVLSASLLRAKAVNEAFAAPEHTFPLFTLALGYEDTKLPALRHNPDWRTYTQRGFSATWSNWRNIYADSRRESSEWSALMEMDLIGAKVQCDPTLSAVSKVLANVKYKVGDLEHYSRELLDRLQEWFR